MKSSYADKGRCILKEGEQGGGIVFLVSGQAVVSRVKKVIKMRVPKRSLLTRCKSSNQLVPKSKLHSGLITLNREVSSLFKIKKRIGSKDESSSKDSLKSLFPTATPYDPPSPMKLFQRVSLSGKSRGLKKDDVEISGEGKGDGRDDGTGGIKGGIDENPAGPLFRPLFPRQFQSSGQTGSLDNVVDRRAMLLSTCSESVLGSSRPSPPPFIRSVDMSTHSEALAERNRQSETHITSSANITLSLSPFVSEMDMVQNPVAIESISETNIPPSYFSELKAQLPSFNLNIKSKKPFSNYSDDKDTAVRPTHSLDDINVNRKKTSNIYRIFGSDRKSTGEQGDGKQKTGEDKGQQVVMGVLSRGEFIGYKEMQFMIKHPSSLTAIEACHYYTLDHSDVLTLMRHNPMVAFEFQRALGLAVDEMDNRMKVAQTQQIMGEFFSEIKDQFKKTKAVAIQSKGLAKVLLEYAAKKQKEKDDIKARAEMSNSDKEFYGISIAKLDRSMSFDSQSSVGSKFSVVNPRKGNTKVGSRRGGTIAEPRLGKEIDGETDEIKKNKWTSIPYFFRRRSRITTGENEIPGIPSKKMSSLRIGSGSGKYKNQNATMSLNKKVAKLNRLHRGLCNMDRPEGYKSDPDLPVKGREGGGVILESSSKSIGSEEISRRKIGYIRKSFISLTTNSKGNLMSEGSAEDIQSEPVAEKLSYYQTLRERLGRRLSLSHRRGSSIDASPDSPSAMDDSVDSPSQSNTNSPTRTDSYEEENRNKIKNKSRSHGRTDYTFSTYGSLKAHRSTADILNRSHDKTIGQHRDDIVLHHTDHIPGLKRATSNPNLY